MNNEGSLVEKARQDIARFEKMERLVRELLKCYELNKADNSESGMFGGHWYECIDPVTRDHVLDELQALVDTGSRFEQFVESFRRGGKDNDETV